MMARSELFSLTDADLDNVERNATLFSVDPLLARNVGTQLLDILSGPDIPGVTSYKLRRIRNEINTKTDTILADEVNYLTRTASPELGVAFDGLKEALGHQNDNPGVGFKIYGRNPGKKMGKGAHRDANFPDATPSVVDAVGLVGQRTFGLWAIPDSIDLGRPMRDHMRDTNDRRKVLMGFEAEHEEKKYRFLPVSTHTLSPGKGVRIDEIHGQWRRPDGIPMSVWHSVYAEQQNGEPVVSAVIRSTKPGPISPQ